MSEQDIIAIVEKVNKKEGVYKTIITILTLAITVGITVASILMGSMNKKIDNLTESNLELVKTLAETNKTMAVLGREHDIFDEDLTDLIQKSDENKDEHETILLRLQRLER